MFGLPIPDFTIPPLVWYSLDGLAVIAVCCVIGWFFPAVRSFCGAVVLAVIGALYAYHRGAQDQEAFDAKRAKEKAKEQNPHVPPFSFPELRLPWER